MNEEDILIYIMRRIFINMKKLGPCYSAISLENQEIRAGLINLIQMGLVAGDHSRPYLTDKGEYLLLDRLFRQKLVNMYYLHIMERDLLGVKD